MLILFRSEVKRILSSPSFWETFPEYKEYRNKNIKTGCCGLKEEFYQIVLGWVKENPSKWKKYLKQDKIQIFFKNKILEF